MVQDTKPVASATEESEKQAYVVDTPYRYREKNGTRVATRTGQLVRLSKEELKLVPPNCLRPANDEDAVKSAVDAADAPLFQAELALQEAQATLDKFNTETDRLFQNKKNEQAKLQMRLERAQEDLEDAKELNAAVLQELDPDAVNMVRKEREDSGGYVVGLSPGPGPDKSGASLGSGGITTGGKTPDTTGSAGLTPGGTAMTDRQAAQGSQPANAAKKPASKS